MYVVAIDFHLKKDIMIYDGEKFKVIKNTKKKSGSGSHSKFSLKQEILKVPDADIYITENSAENYIRLLNKYKEIDSVFLLISSQIIPKYKKIFEADRDFHTSLLKSKISDKGKIDDALSAYSMYKVYELAKETKGKELYELFKNKKMKLYLMKLGITSDTRNVYLSKTSPFIRHIHPFIENKNITILKEFFSYYKALLKMKNKSFNISEKCILFDISLPVVHGDRLNVYMEHKVRELEKLIMDEAINIINSDNYVKRYKSFFTNCLEINTDTAFKYAFECVGLHGDIRRFLNVDKFISFLGLVPFKKKVKSKENNKNENKKYTEIIVNMYARGAKAFWYKVLEKSVKGRYISNFRVNNKSISEYVEEKLGNGKRRNERKFRAACRPIIKKFYKYIVGGNISKEAKKILKKAELI